MKVLSTRYLKDCLDGTIIREVFFDQGIPEPFIRYLEPHGELQFFPNFPVPFFIFEEPGYYIIKGSCGNQHCRIILSKNHQDESLQWFLLRCRNWDCGKADYPESHITGSPF